MALRPDGGSAVCRRAGKLRHRRQRGGGFRYCLSCLCHAAVVALALWILVLPLWLLRLRRVAATLLVGLVSIVAVVIFINMQVYKSENPTFQGIILSLTMRYI